MKIKIRGQVGLMLLLLFVSWICNWLKFVIHSKVIVIEQAIDSKNGGTFINNRNTIRKYSVVDKRRNESKPKLIDHLHHINLSWIMPRKKYWIAGLVTAFLLLVTAIVVPISIYTLNDDQSLESTTFPTTGSPSTATITTLPVKKRGICWEIVAITFQYISR